jgi:hypothetical protein
MTELFGADAAKRRQMALNASSERTAANLSVPPPDAHPNGPAHRVHLHLAPPRMNVLGPLLALLLSAGGLLYGLRSPHANRALSATFAPTPPPAPAANASPGAAPVDGTPLSTPHKLQMLATPPAPPPPKPRPSVHGKSRRHDRQRRAHPAAVE